MMPGPALVYKGARYPKDQLMVSAQRAQYLSIVAQENIFY